MYGAGAIRRDFPPGIGFQKRCAAQPASTAADWFGVGLGNPTKGCGVYIGMMTDQAMLCVCLFALTDFAVVVAGSREIKTIQ